MAPKKKKGTVSDPKDLLNTVQKLLRETKSWHRVYPLGTITGEVERLEQMQAELMRQHETLGVVLGIIKGTKLYAKLEGQNDKRN